MIGQPIGWTARQLWLPFCFGVLRKDSPIPFVNIRHDIVYELFPQRKPFASCAIVRMRTHYEKRRVVSATDRRHSQRIDSQTGLQRFTTKRWQLCF